MNSLKTKHSFNSKKSCFWKFTVGIILLVLCSMTVAELSRSITASTLGYKSNYHRFLVRSSYDSEQMQLEKEKIVKRYDFDDSFFSHDKAWLLWQKKYVRNQAIIEWSGRLTLIIISILGFVLFRRGRKQNKPVNIADLIYLFTGFAFMRDVIMDILDFVVIGRPPHTISLFNLSSATSHICLIIIGLSAFVYLLFNLPRTILPTLTLSSITGVSIGAIIWFGAMHFSHPPDETLAKLSVGQPAKNLKGVFYQSNDSFNLERYKDSIVVLDFFFSTCGPCRYALPHLNQLYDLYHPKGVAFFGVDPIEKDWKYLDRFTEKVQMNYPIVKVKEDSVRMRYGVYSFPTVVVAYKGKVLFKKSGGKCYSGLDQILDKAILQ
ncbi:MAG: redoxin domain-containing protein [Bacteroidetes bacterium]|nr:redoxin domain-containing protein [Bacteroidota bacterium]